MSKLFDNNSIFDPSSDPNIEGNPFKTLFVARLSRDVSERRLRREFEEFGALSRIRIVTNKLSGKPRGYAFIEFERLEDMKNAYKMGMNRNIEGRRILVDVERGRTVADWRPRRLGGGLGGVNQHSQQKLVTKIVPNIALNNSLHSPKIRKYRGLSPISEHQGFPKEIFPSNRNKLHYNIPCYREGYHRSKDKYNPRDRISNRDNSCICKSNHNDIKKDEHKDKRMKKSLSREIQHKTN